MGYMRRFKLYNWGFTHEKDAVNYFTRSSTCVDTLLGTSCSDCDIEMDNGSG